MRVGIDITAVIYDRGVSRYTSNLVQALAERPDVELRLYGASWRQKSRLQQFSQHIIQVAPQRHAATIQGLPPRVQEVMWNTFQINKVQSFFPRLDLFHSWDWLQPPDINLPLISTIHDLAILKFPETAHPKILAMHQKSWQILKHRRAHIIAVSQATRRDIIELLQFPPEFVHVVYESLPNESMRVTQNLTEERAENIKLQLKLERPFILCVGTREPRKNLRRAIESWWPLRKHIDLYIAGAAGWDDTASLQEVLNAPQLRFLDRVTDQELAVLYGEAELLLYPSLYEGFGLPILESFHAGTPVVTSASSSMPEVAGNAAELVDPENVESIRTGIEHILNEPLEAQRQRLQRMILRLQLFSWQRVAEETCKVYRKSLQ